MNGERKLLIAALRSAMTGEIPEVPEQVDWQNFLTLAAVHKIEGLVYSGLKNVALPQEVTVRLKGAYHQAVFYDTQFTYISQQLKKRLTDAQVPHIFLKGACLKQDYPVPALRTMADLDILVHVEDYKKVDEVCAALGGQAIGGDGSGDEFDQMERLEHMTGVSIPVNLATLRGKKELHNGVINKDEMLDFVLGL